MIIVAYLDDNYDYIDYSWWLLCVWLMIVEPYSLSYVTRLSTIGRWWWPNVGKYTSPMDPMGIARDAIFFVAL